MWCLLPFAYFLLALGGHALFARLHASGNRVPQFVLVGSTCGLALVFHLSKLSETPATAYLAAVVVYAFACELYIFLFSFVTSSVSVALLVAGTRQAGPDQAEPASLSPTEMVEQRLRMLGDSGLLDRRQECYHLNGRSRMIVAVYRALRRFFRHDGS
jgi:membrane-bound ClpP family serine protease